MNHTELIELRKLADAAPKGQWMSTSGMVYELQHYGWKKGEEIFENRWSASVQTHFDQKEIAPHITNYIAAANPAAVISLLDQIQALEAEVERLTPLQFRQAPCHKFCEATAFNIEIKQLRSQIDALKLDVKRYLKALKKIAMTEYHIERPPIESLEEQMRKTAIAAMKGAA